MLRKSTSSVPDLDMASRRSLLRQIVSVGGLNPCWAIVSFFVTPQPYVGDESHAHLQLRQGIRCMWKDPEKPAA